MSGRNSTDPPQCHLDLGSMARLSAAAWIQLARWLEDDYAEGAGGRPG